MERPRYRFFPISIFTGLGLAGAFLLVPAPKKSWVDSLLPILAVITGDKSALRDRWDWLPGGTPWAAAIAFAAVLILYFATSRSLWIALSRAVVSTAIGLSLFHFLRTPS